MKGGYIMCNVPERCIDPVMKYCQKCEWGYVVYPDWVETYEDTFDCIFESGCILGFDQGRPEDEPTEDEIKEFDLWCNAKSHNYEQSELKLDEAEEKRR